MRRRSSSAVDAVKGRSRGVAIAPIAFASLVAMVTAGSAESLAQPRDTALERQAASYVRFREDVAQLEKTPFSSPETTRDAHRRLSAHQSATLSAGWVAYAALVAADTPEFAEALKTEVGAGSKRKSKKGDLAGRDAFFAKLAEDPGYLRSLKGADQARARVLAVTAQDTGRFIMLGEAFKEQAYAMQRTSWGKAKIASSEQRLNDADGFGRSRPMPQAPAMSAAESGGVVSPSLASADASWNPDWGVAASRKPSGEPNADVVMDRVLNLAARYAVGGVNEKIVSVYAKNDRADRCMSMAALTLRQCIAATRAPYEEAFCLGEHALNDVAECVGWVAGVNAS